MAATLPSIFAFSTGFRRISIVLLWFWLVAHVDAQNGSAEVQTLLRFKYMTTVDTWVLTRGYYSTWKDTDKSPCAWWGVTCTDTSTVERLVLSGWGLTGLPSLGVLSNLTDLRELDLSFNTFRGQDTAPSLSIPEDIGSLVGLTYLDLSFNAFSGPIPSNISACRKLRFIAIEENALTGEIPDLSGLMQLQYLYLGGNKLSGPFPKWLGHVNNLLAIRLSVNNFTGAVPSLSNLTNLLEVELDDNSFTGFEEPIFPGAKSLEHLSVKGNQLEGPIPESITNFLNIRLLDLSSNRLSGHIPSGFSLNMSQAISLNLSYNQLTGNIPQNLLQPTTTAIHLPILAFSSNLLTGSIPFDATKNYNYQTLDFSNNTLSGSVPSICSNGSSFISQLWLQNNQLEGDLVDFLAHCYSFIGDLQLANNSFSGDLSRIPLINTTPVSVGIPQTVALSNNKLWMSTKDANPDPLRGFLEFLVLNSSVTEFRMPGNNFSGTRLPAYFSVTANSLQVLDLSSNHLIGEISDAAFNGTWLPALQSLSLSNNDLTGPISEAVVMLPNLDVSNNSLSGPLPPTLPSAFNPSLFLGNNGLCGGPLRACTQATGVHWWVLLVVIGGSAMIAVGSFLAVLWRWRVYRKMHQQDADLIKTLLERESAALMPLRELRKATNNFAEDAQIGEGGFGKVYTGKLTDGTVVAIKRSKFEGLEKDKDLFLNEVRILSQVNHRHLVKLLGCCMENKTALLVFEFVSNGTLQEHLQGKIGGMYLSWKQRLQIAIQIADALNYLHAAATSPIYHRDVKSANILLDMDLNAKVADFGISKLAPIEATHVTTVALHGTIGYIDPEFYASCHLTDKSDVYSFGVVLLELLSAKAAVDFMRGGDKTSLVNFAKTYIEDGDLQELIDEALVDTYHDLANHGKDSILNVGRLALKCLQMQSKARPSMHQVWKELQNMWSQLHGTSEDLEIVNCTHKTNMLYEHRILLSGSSPCNSSTFSLEADAISIQVTSR